MDQRLGELLLQAKRIREDQLEEALARQTERGGRLGTNLVETGALTLDVLSVVLATQRAIPAATVKEFEQATPAAVGQLSPELAARFCAFPLRAGPSGLAVAMASPWDVAAVQELSRAVKRNVIVKLAPELRILEYLEKRYGVQNPRKASAVKIGEAFVSQIRPPSREMDLYLNPTPTADTMPGRGEAAKLPALDALPTLPGTPFDPGPFAGGPFAAGPFSGGPFGKAQLPGEPTVPAFEMPDIDVVLEEGAAADPIVDVDIDEEPLAAVSVPAAAPPEAAPPLPVAPRAAAPVELADEEVDIEEAVAESAAPAPSEPVLSASAPTVQAAPVPEATLAPSPEAAAAAPPAPPPLATPVVESEAEVAAPPPTAPGAPREGLAAEIVSAGPVAEVAPPAPAPREPAGVATVAPAPFAPLAVPAPLPLGTGPATGLDPLAAVSWDAFAVPSPAPQSATSPVVEVPPPAAAPPAPPPEPAVASEPAAPPVAAAEAVSAPGPVEPASAFAEPPAAEPVAAPTQPGLPAHVDPAPAPDPAEEYWAPVPVVRPVASLFLVEDAMVRSSKPEKVIETLMWACEGRFEAAVFFAIDGQRARARDAFGPMGPIPFDDGFAIELSEPSLLREAASQERPQFQPAPTPTAADVAIGARMGVDPARPTAVLPFLIHGSVVGALWACTGSFAERGALADEVERLADMTARAFLRLPWGFGRR